MITKAGKYYLKLGWSIIPVGKDKKPLIEWKDYQKERVTDSDFDNWVKYMPNMQLGVVTGQISGIIVVDIDNPDLDRSWLPNTLIARTGSGGYHYYYQYTEGYTNKARIKEFIDIRADGGYCILPPSENLKGKYEWINKCPLAPFPVNLFEKPKKVNYTHIRTEYTGANQGSRNEDMARYAGHLLAKVHPTEWDYIAYPIFEEANQKNNPPLDDRELRSIFDSIKDKERRNTTERWYKQQEQVKEEEEKRECKLIVKKDYKPRYTWGTNGLDKSFAIIKRGNFIIVGAKQSQGKTAYTFDMACKNALLGHKVLYISLEMEGEDLKSDIGRKYSGITIEEEYNYNIPEHKQKAFDQKVKEINEIPNFIFKGMRRGTNTRWETIAELIKETEDVDIVFIDNLDLIDGERGEDNNERQKRITKRIMSFTAEYNIPIVLVHHHRKSGGKDYGADELTGSGKIKDNADIILSLTRVAKPEDTPIYPENLATRIIQQKGRGYPEAYKLIYFIKGSFEDEAPSYQEYFYEH